MDYENQSRLAVCDCSEAGTDLYYLPQDLFLLSPGIHYPEAVETMAKCVYPEGVQVMKETAKPIIADHGMGPQNKRRISLLVIFAVLACLGGVVSVMKGSVEIPVQEIFSALAGHGAGTHEQILMNIRLPRTLVAALVGVNLALSGAILQAIMKNPLADPHIIGISSGAGLMGILVLLVLPEMGWLVTPAAFVGAMGAAMLIYILSWKNGIRPIRIILAGVAVSAFRRGDFGPDDLL